MKNKFSIALSLLLVGATTFNSLPVQACAFDMEPYYTFNIHPDVPLNGYAAGKLGIIQPRFARSYLLVAYRYLSGKPLTADEQKAAVSLWNTRMTDTVSNCPSDASAWLKARADIPGMPKIEQIFTERSVNNDDSWNTYCNCQFSAFNTAATTLGGLVKKWGADSAPVKDWVKAQDDVFVNCGKQMYSDKPQVMAIPTPLPDSADAGLQKDRNYQIASANFYAQNFKTARQLFEDIAKDTTSPWQHTAMYLAARAMIRQATLAKELDTGLLAEAKKIIEDLMSNSAYADMKSDLEALHSFVMVRLLPGQHIEDLSNKPFTTENLDELTSTIDRALGESDNDGSSEYDYAKLTDAVKKPEMIDWVMTMQSTGDAGKKHAIEKWKATHSVPWLVAVALDAEKGDPDAQAILKAADSEQSKAAHWTLFYHSNRLNMDNDKNDLVRGRLDKVLASPPQDLPTGSVNKLKTQRLALSRNLKEFVSYGIQTPLSICSNGGIPEVPDDMEQIVKTGKGDKYTPLFTPEAGDVLHSKLPLSMLKQLSIDTSIPTNLRNNVAWTSWVRAILVGDDTQAKQLAAIAKPFNAHKSSLFADYLSAPTPDARKFAATFLMMQFSSANPDATYGPLQDDDYGDSSGWWWGKGHANTVFYPNQDDSASFDPLFVTDAQSAQNTKEQAKLATVEGAPNYFAGVVLPWAKAHPADPRVPKALHFLVKATHYGATDERTTGYSKEAFKILHSKYKGNTWTKQTPYWY